MDETSARRGQGYVSFFFDMDQRRLLFGTEGKDHKTVKAFIEDLDTHNGSAGNVTDASLDMSKAFIKGVREAMPNAEITFDPFHLIKLMNDSLSKLSNGFIEAVNGLSSRPKEEQEGIEPPGIS
jgi:transposase